MTQHQKELIYKKTYELFDYNLALKSKTEKELARDLIVPSHYFGSGDALTDLSELEKLKILKLINKLNIDARVDLVIENTNFSLTKD